MCIMDQGAEQETARVAQRYQLLGKCYVYGLMDEEAIGMLEKEQVELREFVLQ